jgi:thiol-disulfide isomerase/thioredoxin
MSRILLLFIVLSLVISCGCNEKTPDTVGLEVGQVAPALQGADTTGQLLNLSDYRGKVVLVDFWATWCPPCREMIPHNKELAKRLDGQPFVILGVSADHEEKELKTFVSEKQISWPNIFDGPRGPLAGAWRIEGFPTVFVVDAKGVIRYKQVGYDRASMTRLENAIDKLLKDMRY